MVRDLGKIRLTSIGPLPPPLGGTTVLFEDYASRISGIINDHAVINTTNDRRGIMRLLREMKIIIQVIASPFRSDVVALHASVYRSIAFGALLYLLSLATGARIIVRCFGGGHDIQLRNAPRTILLLEFLTFRNALILLETEHLCQWASQRHPKATIDWHPNCRELSEISEVRTIREDRFVFLGKVCADKGVDVILDMKERWPDDPFVVELIGPLDGTISEERLKGVNGVEYVGILSPAAASAKLKRCQALILPTRYEGEGHPGAILEAYAQGTPVIATRWRAVPEIVIDGKTGLLIDVDAVEQLRHAILRMLNDRNLVAAMQIDARSAAENFTSQEWHADKWKTWMSNILIKGCRNDKSIG